MVADPTDEQNYPQASKLTPAPLSFSSSFSESIRFGWAMPFARQPNLWTGKGTGGNPPVEMEEFQEVQRNQFRFVIVEYNLRLIKAPHPKKVIEDIVVYFPLSNGTIYVIFK